MYKRFVANKRHPDQRLVAFALPSELLVRLDAARKVDGRQRSAYIREAIQEKLAGMGVAVPTELKDAPDRTGKTYQPRTIKSYKADAKTVSTAEVKAIADKIALGDRSAARSKRKG